MITARLLNQDASLNNYSQIGGISFVNNDTIRVVIQLYNEELRVRHLPQSTATVTLGVNFSDGTVTSDNNIGMANFPAVNGATDTSIWFADIVTNNVAATTKTLVGGNVTFAVTGDGNSFSPVYRGIIFNALQRIIVS